MSELPGVNYEAALVNAIIAQKAMREVKKLKIDSSFFFDTTSKAAFLYLESYFQNPHYLDQPSAETFRARFPQFPRVELEESVRAICDQLRSEVAYNDIRSNLEKINDLAQVDPGAAMQLFRTAGAEMFGRHHVDNARTVLSLVDEIKADYLRMEADPAGLKGWGTPWPALDKQTLGAIGGELGVIYARPKRLKTWQLIKFAEKLNAQGIPGIVFSQELPVKQLAARYVAVATRVNYSKFLRGRLPPGQREDFLQDLEVFSERPQVAIDRIDGTGDAAVAEVLAKCEDQGARWFMIDGVYKLGMDDWRELARVTAGLKKGCLDREVFGLLTSQGKAPQGKGRNEGSGDDMAYGQMFQVDCDWGIHIARDIEDLNARRVTMTLAFIREGQQARWTVKAQLCESMGQIEELRFDEGSDLEDTEVADEAADDAVYRISEEFADPSKPDADTGYIEAAEQEAQQALAPVRKRLVIRRGK